jgi:hypothetical protein
MLLAEYSRVRLHSATEFLRHDTNINLLSLLTLIKGLNPSLTIPSRYWKVIINDVSGVISKFATPVSTSNQINIRIRLVQLIN